jgi:hypothetical protein
VKYMLVHVNIVSDIYIFRFRVNGLWYDRE